MSYLVDHWSFDPFLVLAIIVAGWHEVGLRRLARGSAPERARERRLRSLWFYAGLVVMLLALESPLDYWTYDYFFVHMIQHLLLMFAAPSLLVAGAPGRPLLEGLPWQRVTREVLAGGWSAPLRAVGGFFRRPWVCVGLFSAVMILWHLPGPYDLAETNRAVHLWLMEGSFLAAGVLFWLQFIPSPPFIRRMPPLSQAAALLGTNFVMIFIAMALSIFSSHSVYSVYDHLPGVTLPPYADQQIGAAILWVCGDFWAMPAMIVVIRRMMADEGSVSAALDKMLGRDAAAPGVRGGWGRLGAAAGGRARHRRADSAAVAAGGLTGRLPAGDQGAGEPLRRARRGRQRGRRRGLHGFVHGRRRGLRGL